MKEIEVQCFQGCMGRADVVCRIWRGFICPGVFAGSYFSLPMFLWAGIVLCLCFGGLVFFFAGVFVCRCSCGLGFLCAGVFV